MAQLRPTVSNWFVPDPMGGGSHPDRHHEGFYVECHCPYCEHFLFETVLDNHGEVVERFTPRWNETPADEPDPGIEASYLS